MLLRELLQELLQQDWVHNLFWERQDFHQQAQWQEVLQQEFKLVLEMWLQEVFFQCVNQQLWVVLEQLHYLHQLQQELLDVLGSQPSKSKTNSFKIENKLNPDFFTLFNIAININIYILFFHNNGIKINYSFIFHFTIDSTNKSQKF